MAKLKGQLFARLALDYFDHPKIMRLSSEAIVAHLEMIVYSRKYETDGLVPVRFATRFAKQVLQELAENDEESPSVVLNDDGSVSIYGYEAMQETSDQINARRQVRREAGRKGGLAKVANAKQTLKPVLSNGFSKNVAETETETETYITPAGDVHFDAFWEVYPRSIAKKEAMKKFDKAVKDGANPQAIIDGAKAYAGSVAGKEQKYIAHPTTWLNQGRWEDQVETTTTMSDSERADRLRNPWKYT